MQSILDLPPPPADSRHCYGDLPSQFGDLWVPDGPGLHPVVVYLHGGFWRARFDLSHAGHVCDALKRAGWATWSLEYRRIGEPGGGCPGTMDDVLRGAQHLNQLAAPFKLNLGRVVVAGHSAGGHLALWLAANWTFPILGVTSLAGVCDLRRAWELQLSETVVEQFLGGSPAGAPDRYAMASPIERLPIAARQRLVHGTADTPVPFELSERFVKASRNAELISLEDAGHLELIDPRAKEWTTVLKSITEW